MALRPAGNTILQWNCGGFFHHLAELKQLLCRFPAICLAIQETWFPVERTPALRGYRGYYRNRADYDRVSGGVCIYVLSTVPSAPVPLQTALEAVAVRIRVDQEITICSVYLSPDEVVPPADLAALVAQLPPPFLLLGDFNAHNPLWGGTQTSGRGREIEALLTQQDLCLLNTGAPTHFSVAHGTYSAIDLSICSSSLLPHVNWKVYDDLCGSDHFPILLSLPEFHPPDHLPRWSLHRADWPAYTSAAVVEVQFPAEIDTAVGQVTTTIVTAAEATVPCSVGSLRRKTVPWWTPEIAEAIRQRRRALQRHRRHPSMEHLIAFKRLRARARRLIQQSKKDCWERYVSSIGSRASLSRVWSQVRRLFGYRPVAGIPCLSIHGTPSTDPTAIAEHLAEHYARSSATAAYSPMFRSLKERVERQRLSFHTNRRETYNAPFSEWEFRSALAACPDTSPGPDRVHSQFLRHLSADSKCQLLALFNRIWAEGAFPSQWRDSIIIPVLKPGSDPMAVDSYRPISLTNVLCKLLERMVSRRLMWLLEARGLLVPQQGGFRQGRSALDNLVSLESAVRTAFARREHLIAVFFDLRKAYDTTWRHHILATLFEWGLRGSLPTFIQNFLSLRSFRVRVGASLSSSHVQENGVPQGSVLSVPLFLVAINGLATAVGSSVYSSLFADDFCVYFHSTSIGVAERRLQGAIKKAQSWAFAHGFQFSATKTRVMHFCRRRAVHPEPELYLADELLRVEETHRFLGMLLDAKLTWLPHLRQLKQKCWRHLNVLRCLSHTVWGTARPTLLRLYMALVQSRLDYGSFIYDSAAPSALRILDPILHSGVRLATGAFRTSPVTSLLTEAGILPLRFRRQQLFASYVAHVHASPYHPNRRLLFPAAAPTIPSRRPRSGLPISVRVRTLLSSLESLPLLPALLCQPQTPPWSIPRLQLRLDLSCDSKASVSSLTLRRKFLAIIDEFRGAEIAYTDGSSVDGRVGYAYVCGDHLEQRSLPPGCSVFTAELVAISRALEHLWSRPRKSFVICSDSLSGLQALDQCFPYHPLVQSIHNTLFSLGESGCSVAFLWTPGHVGIPGNEYVDQLAKEATTARPLDIGVPERDIRLGLQRKVYEAWNLEWSASSTPNKLRMIKPSTAPWKSSLRPYRRDSVVLCRLRIGHTRLTHGHLLRNEDPPKCRCGAVMTVVHILVDCPLLTSLRRAHNLPAAVPSILGDDASMADNILRFIRAAGFYHTI